MSENKKDTYEIWDNERIRTARELAGITREHAVTAFSIHPAYLPMIEQGKRQPGPSLIAQMSILYKQPMAYFLKSEKNLAVSSTNS